MVKLKKKGKEKGDVNIAVLQGTIGSSAEIGRTKGFKEGIKDQKNFKIMLLRQENYTGKRSGSYGIFLKTEQRH